MNMAPSPSRSFALELDSLQLAYPSGHGEQTVVYDLSLQLEQGEIACLLGPSGCGKTTVLRAIAGFQRIQSGRVVLHQHEVGSPRVHLAPEQRQIGMVFQDYALFPHLDVAANVGFGLHGLDRETKQQRVKVMLQLVGLEALAKRAPH